jgi:hypothetical protein
MRTIPWAYRLAVLFCVVYWLLWFVPQAQVLIGQDGGWFFGVGIFSLWILPLLLLAWLHPDVRKAVYFPHGRWLGNLLVATIALFFMWGMYLVVSLYIHGI